MTKSEKGNISVKFSQNCMKVNQVIYIMYLNCTPDTMILAQAILQIFCSQGCFAIQNAKVGKGRYSDRLYLGHNVYAIHHDPSSSGSPDILFTRFHTMQKTKKGHNSATRSLIKKTKNTTPFFIHACSIYTSSRSYL